MELIITFAQELDEDLVELLGIDEDTEFEAYFAESAASEVIRDRKRHPVDVRLSALLKARFFGADIIKKCKTVFLFRNSVSSVYCSGIVLYHKLQEF